MKKFIYILTLSITILTNGQTLEHKIPSNAKAVISINGNRLLELMSITDFNQSKIAKEMFFEINRRKDSLHQITTIEDFGFDINSKAYYFFQTTDSINYHHMLIKINDKTKFENLLTKSDSKNIEKKRNFNMLASYSNVSIWNDKMLLFSFSDEHYEYFSHNKERFLKLAQDDETIYEIKRRLSKNWLKNNALIVFNGSSRSILTNSSYTKRIDNTAAASFWIDNYSELIDNTMRSSIGYLFLNPYEKPTVNSYGIDGVWGNFYLENDKALLKANMEINKDWISIYKKMYKSKLNAEFFNHFDQNNVLAYASMSFNMQNMLEAYPKIVSNMYGGMMPKYKEEIEAAAEVTAVLLDEKAIGKTITGNMLFVLNAIEEKEVSYTSYEYDEDYKRTEVTKTKTEPIPDFTIMIGSENKKLIHKFIRLGAKHELVHPLANYYKFKVDNDIPFDLFFVMKNKIAFLTTSEKRIKAIANGTNKGNVGKHKKMMRKNISVFYVNGKELLNEIPNTTFSSREKKFLDFAKENLTEAYLTTSRIKGNKVQMELKLDTPSKHGNSLKFFLSFFETFID